MEPSWLVSHVGLNVSVFSTYSLLLWHPTARNCEVGDQETHVTPSPEEAGYGLKLHKTRPSGLSTITLHRDITVAIVSRAAVMRLQIILNSIFAVYLHSSTQSHTAIMLPSGDQEQPLQSRVGSCVRFARTQPEALEKTER